MMQMTAWIALALSLCAFASTQAPLAPTLSTAPNAQSTRSAASTRVQPEMKAGEEADVKRDYAAAMAAYRKAIEIDPQNTDAHKHFILAASNQADVAFRNLFDNPNYEKFESGKLHGKDKKVVQAEIRKADAQSKAGQDALLETYDRWIAAHPKMAVFYWAKGYALETFEKPFGEEELFQKAISLDPKFAPAYKSMADLEYEKGEYSKQRAYLKQAMDLDPANPEALRAFAETFQFSDPAEFRQLVQRYTKQFPKGSYRTYLLYQLESIEPNAAERLSILNAMRRNYVDRPVSTLGMNEPDVFTNSLEESMVDLFKVYAETDPQKALDLAQEVQKQKWADPAWKSVVAYQQNAAKAQQLIATGKYSAATALLQPPPRNWITQGLIGPANLEKAEALAGSGRVQQAFDAVSAAWIKAPDPQLKGALLKYGAKLGKTSEQVDDLVWRRWTADAREMKPFQLKNMSGTKKIKLSDFRGRAVLVSFWFPLCGPCRQEMPYLGEVAKRYASQGFAILAINGVPAQDSYAPGVLKNYDIIGLKVPSKKWAEQYDNVHAYPTNYLLDAHGQIMAHPRVFDVDTLKIFEMQVDALLAHRTPQGSSHTIPKSDARN